jgi:formate hydrogenlyase subunit 3/multisubunit Na+/H+ antiporter MnhD subunit
MRRDLAGIAERGDTRVTIVWLAALPLGVALLVLLLRALPLVTTPISAATLIALAVLLVSQKQSESFIVWGRSISLMPQETAGLAFCALLLAVMLIYSYRIPQGLLAQPLTLAAMGLFIAATMMRNAAIAGLLIEIGVLVAVMLIPSRQPGAAMTGIRTLVILALCGPLLLLAAWAMESRAIKPNDILLARISGVALVLGFGIGMAIVPFHIWQPPVFRYGGPLAAVMLSVVLGIVVTLRLNSMLTISMWAEERPFFMALLLGGGILTALLGGFMALSQRSVSRALAYAGLADLGLVLIGLGIGSETSSSAAILHLAYRGIGIVVVCMALGILRQCLDGDDLEHLRGALRRAPLAVIGMTLGGLSLAGLPLTAGFSSRFVLYRALASTQPTWALAVMVSSIGPVWAFMRCLVAALVSAPTSGGQREPLMPGLLTVLLGLTLVALGISPALLKLLPMEWVSILFRGTFGAG